MASTPTTSAPSQPTTASDDSQPAQSASQRHCSIRERLSKRKEQLGLLASAATAQVMQPDSNLDDVFTTGKESLGSSGGHSKKKRKVEDDSGGVAIEDLLREPTAKEKEKMQLNSEILELLAKPTVKELSTVEKFRSDGTQVKEFCPHGTKENCVSSGGLGRLCQRLHFRKIIQKHTDESLGDCSFLNTCFHMSTCKYIHYEIDYEIAKQSADETTTIISTGNTGSSPAAASAAGQVAEQQQQRTRRYSGSSTHSALTDAATTTGSLSKAQTEQPTILFPPQWIQCDLRFFDLTVLGKFSVVMADPPWDIHMELPYGTMSDDEMRSLNIQCLQDEGLIFLWVTGRAMELGRECLRLWGYEQCEEIIWVKTNQLQRIIRTGRTGHWLNHGKEHCLVGVKGSIQKFNRGLDSDVIVAEVRATSHKPDEVYGLIERLSPGTRKVELFGRQHNVQHNWVTLGNQLDGVRLLDPEVVTRFRRRYPDGNCMPKPETVLEYKQKQMAS